MSKAKSQEHEPKRRIHAFILASSALTGFSPFELYGTGQAEAYFGFVSELSAFESFTSVMSRLPEGGAAQEAFLRREVMDVEGLGQFARSLIKLWYLGQWDGQQGQVQILSAASYREGLVWQAIGAHPQGAKQQGYGAWAMPPKH